MADHQPEDAPVSIPITGELDLHTFRPSEIGILIPEYLNECRKRGLYRVRIIHGKGTGSLREGVHRLLQKQDCIIDFHLGDQTSGSWGATIAHLHPLPDSKQSEER